MSMPPRRPFTFATLALLAALPAAALAAGALPANTVVRVQASGIEPGWHEGKIGTARNGCTMVYLDTKAKGGYTSVSLKGAAKMQRRDGSAWVDVPVRDLARAEPKPCQEGDND